MRDLPQKAPIFVALMFPWSLVYWLFVTVRRKFYDWRLLSQIKLPGRTISIGNLSLGGTGKTPVVIALARHLVARGSTVCVLARGYGSDLRNHDFLVLQNGGVLVQSRPSFLRPDEAFLISSQVPEAWVVVGPKRAANAERFMKQLDLRPDYWLLDDGLQHLALARDCDLVLLSGRQTTAGQGFAAGPRWQSVLPLGPWRESAGVIGRVQYVLLTKSCGMQEQEDLKSWIQERWPHVPVGIPAELFRLRQLAELAPVGLQELKQKGIVLACAIADPGRLEEQVRQEGFKITKCDFFPDHQSIPEETLRAYPPGTGVMITSKDLARQPELFGRYEHLHLLVCDYEIILPNSLLTMLEHHS